MRGDLVILDSAKIEAHRKKRLLGKSGFYDAVGVFSNTGAKLLRGQPVSLLVARRVSDWMGGDLETLIERWVDDVGDGTKGLAVLGESTQRNAVQGEARQAVAEVGLTD